MWYIGVMAERAKVKNTANWGVIGHQPVVKALQCHLEVDKVNHAYLFVGPESVGKRKVALEFAKALFCPETAKPCGRCQACQQIEAGQQVDVTAVAQTKGKIKIAQVREIQHQLSLKSYSGGCKVCIIDGADHFTLPAANAMLKILEEPASQVKFILLAESMAGVIPTIISRAVVFNFNLVAREDIEKGLTALKKDSPRIAQSAFGRPGLALKYLNNSDELTQRRKRQQELLEILNQDVNSAFQLINNWKVKKEQAGEFIDVMTKYFRDLAVSKAGCPELTLAENDPATGNHFSGRQVKNILNYLVTASSLLTQNINPKLIIENFILMLHHDQT